MALSSQMGAAPFFACFGSQGVAVTGTTLALSANFVNATSGTATSMRFISPVTQSSGALAVYAFMTTKSGSPTAITAAIFAGPSGAMDDDRPDTGAALATAAVDVSAQTNNTWTTFSLTGVSLTAGATYWIVIYNATGTPASNNATYMTRGWNGIPGAARFPAYNTTDGFTTDPAVVSAAADAVIVLKFDDNSLLGSPYAVSNAHANNAVDRGNRYRFDAAVQVVGIYHGLAATTITAFKVYQGASEIGSVTLDKSEINNNGVVYFDSPVTMSAATDYDVVGKYSGNTTVGARIDGGSSAPADVVSCYPATVSFVDGATPGSYTEQNGFTSIMLIVNNFPAAAGGAVEPFRFSVG